nr:MAG TPA: hypothetical protein [Bacteriophage sp.]
MIGLLDSRERSRFHRFRLRKRPLLIGQRVRIGHKRRGDQLTNQLKGSTLGPIPMA